MPIAARVTVLATLAAMSAAAPAGAGESLAALLGQVGPAKAPEGSVEVLSWVERSGPQPELVVTLVPKGAVKLVADPGVTVTPVPRSGVTWSAPSAITEPDGGLDYFPEPPTLRLPFTAEDGKPVEAGIEYAYCLVDFQCLFGEAKVSVPTEPPRG